MKDVPEALQRFIDTVITYRPKQKGKATQKPKPVKRPKKAA